MAYLNLTFLLFIAAFFFSMSGAYRNPVIYNIDAKTPRTLSYGGFYYTVFGSKDSLGWFPIYQSNDLQHWGQVGVVLPTSKIGNLTWRDGGAQIVAFSDGSFRCYFHADDNSTSIISVAYAFHILGPYTIVDKPILSNSSKISNPFIYLSDTTKTLFWDSEGSIYSSALSDDGMTSNGSLTKILTGDQFWESNNLTEPTVIYTGSYFYIFYNGGAYCSSDTIGVAYGSSLTGSFKKSTVPLLLASDIFLNTRSPQVLSNESVIIYTAYKTSCAKQKQMFIQHLEWNDILPSVNPPFVCECSLED